MKTRKLNSNDIDDIVKLFKEGLNKLNIAKKYAVHHTTIMYHLDKRLGIASRGFVVRGKINGNGNFKALNDSENHFDLIESHRPFKSYDDYLNEADQRRIAKQAVCPHECCRNIIICKDCGIKITEDL